MNNEDIKELEEVIKMVRDEAEVDQSVVAHLSFGDYVVTPKELFDNLIDYKGAPHVEEIIVDEEE